MYFFLDLSQIEEKLLTHKKRVLTFNIMQNLFFWRIQILKN